ncbi:MAG: hypothetical protein JW768_07220 [Chitinispirillaceae bacterium]|nr:hypothetical protein [Chitinispirillaceae bacterium]
MMKKTSGGLSAIFLLCIALSYTASAVTWRVSKDGTGDATTIMAAMQRAQAGDIVQITDLSTYEEQVVIDSTKNGLTLCSSNPTSINKPRIRWQDRVNVGPRTFAESQIDSMITFDRNGALQLLGARNVTIDGIAIDGGGPYAFGYTAIWNNQYPLQHGNGAISLWMCGAIHVKNCSISNAYFGINFKDRNQGGIFGNPNPADNEPWRVVPLSGFGKSGNHIIEYNRIHHNSFGMFFESSWDLGSTIRYNLIYENHHHSSAFATQVKGITSEGNNQPGGAMMFKDVILSPLAIYNNTFWHNFLELVGNWKVGYHHLVFNNIFGAPYKYLNTETIITSIDMDICRCLVNRMHNCVFAAHIQAPTANYTPIFNNMTAQAVNNIISPGAYVITNTTPAMTTAAEVHWLETPFLSTDSASTNFLTPDWNDPLVQQYIVNKGWTTSGVRDPDGSAADLGAIPQGGGRPVDVSTIIPNMPILLNNTTASVDFTLSPRAGNTTSPSIKLHEWVGNLPYDANPWSSGWAAGIIPATNIRAIPAPATPIAVGRNTYNITIPAQTTSYGFLEMIIEGTGSNSLPFTSTVGFVPYRKLEYKFVVDVLDPASGTVLTEVRAGDTVVLRIRAYKADNTIFPNTVKPTEVRLQSGFTLFSTDVDPAVALTLPNGVPGTPTGSRSDVMFTRVPPGGIETIIASGQWIDGTNVQAFLGSCNIKILPGQPETVVFQDPPSVKFNAIIPLIYPGIPYDGLLYVYDRFGNRIDQPATVNLSSLQPAIGNIVGTAPVSITTDATGSGIFQVEVTNGSMGQIFSIRADLPGKLPDTARLKVGAPRERLWIFYSDTAAYDLSVILQGTVGERLPVVIMCGRVANLDSAVQTANFDFLINGATTGLEFYATSTAATPSDTFTLVNGRATLWVTSSVAITNGQFAVTPDTVNTVLGSDPRDKIYFIKPLVKIDSAFYYTNNGFGRVDRVEVYFQDTLAFVPDSMIFYWPAKLVANPNRRVVTAAGGGMTLDPANSRHVTVTLATPFPQEITAGNTGEFLGTTWNRPNSSPGTAAEATDFQIQERVGPLAMRALLVERIGGGAGIDTLYVTFSEPIVPATLVGTSLILKKAGVESQLTVTEATASGTNRYKLVVTGASAPVVGDSLRLQPGGPITDTDSLRNTPHLNNRPVVIEVKLVPAPVVAAKYQDRNADGHVDFAVFQFGKKVMLSDCIIALDWGVSSIDSIPTARLAAVVTAGAAEDSVIEANIAGLFAGLTGIKTSGGMFTTVEYRSIPGEQVTGDVADSAAPVLIDSAHYYPGTAIDASTSYPDTIVALFSEPIAATLNNAVPFDLLSVSTNTGYTFSVVTPSPIPMNQNRCTFVVVPGSLTPAAVSIPRTGDSVRIHPAAGVRDAQGAVLQSHPANHRVVLKVHLRPSWTIAISKNPFSPDTSIINIAGVPNQRGIAITIRPIGRMGDISDITKATATLYDAVGNLVADKTDFIPVPSYNIRYFTWNGANKNNRNVSTGTYLAVLQITDKNGINSKELIKIGVKR